MDQSNTAATQNDLASQIATLLKEGKQAEAKELLTSVANKAMDDAGNTPLLDTLKAHLTVENGLLAEYEALLTETIASSESLSKVSSTADDTAQLQETRKILQ